MISAVIVHFRGTGALGRCLDGAMEIARIGEVLVVDNQGVGHELRRRHPDRRVRIIEMGRNVGYGAAANVGLGEARGSQVLLLNQDTRPSASALEAMVRAGANSGAWLVGPRLVGDDGKMAAPKQGFPPPLSWRGGRRGRGWRERPWIPGAAILFTEGHTDLRFDERLFMYAEDEELCWRVWASGGRVVEAEQALMVHEGGTATTQRWSRLSIVARTMGNRLRMVTWHGGWRAALAHGGAVLRQGARRRVRRGRPSAVR